eukprot:574561-Pyramimonas_sp.AAC.1
MCASLRREPHFEKGQPYILEAGAVFQDECARRLGESQFLITALPQSVKLVQISCSGSYAMRRTQAKRPARPDTFVGATGRSFLQGQWMKEEEEEGETE